MSKCDDYQDKIDRECVPKTKAEREKERLECIELQFARELVKQIQKTLKGTQSAVGKMRDISDIVSHWDTGADWS